MSFCLNVTKNLANRWTDRVLLNKVASGNVHNYFGGRKKKEIKNPKNIFSISFPSFLHFYPLIEKKN